MSLTETDKADILGIAAIVSERPIKKVLASTMLPTSIPFIRVSYEEEVIGTWVIETSLEIRRRDARDWAQPYLDSLDIGRGAWATKRELFRRDVLRQFRIDGSEIRLRQADGLSYDELHHLLHAIKKKAVVWKAPKMAAMDVPIEAIYQIRPSRSAWQYGISLMPGPGPITYFLEAVFDGTTVVITAASMGIP